MALLPERVFVNGDAHVYLAPVGTAAPTDPTASIGNGLTGGGAGLLEVGYFTEDSLSFSTDPNFETITAHQDNYPIRRVQTSDEATLEVDLEEWSSSNFKAVYGGGTVAETSLGSGIWQFTPPALGVGGSGRQEVMCVVKCIDGSRIYALVIPRAMQTEGVEHDLGKGQSAVLPLRLSVLGSGGAAPFYWLTNDNAAWVGALPVFTSRTPTGGVAAGGTPVNIVGSGLNTVNNVLFGRQGTATSATTTVLTDTAATGWVASGFVGGTLDIVSGTGAGQSRTITANTTTTITVGVAFGTAPDATSVYRAYKPAASFYVNGPGTQITAVSPASVATQVMHLLLANSVGATVNGGAPSAFTYS